MKQILNAQIILIAVGVLQPARAVEVLGFLETVLPHAGMMPTADAILNFLKERERGGHLVRVARDEAGGLYSLTIQGHRFLSPSQRRLRDKLRFYLLRDSHRGKIRELEDGAQRLIGAAPIVDNSTPEKGSVANKIGQRVPSGRSYWPRISKQFDSKTGSKAPSSSNFPAWLSFGSLRQCEIALGLESSSFQFNLEGLAVCLGVSVKIISQIAAAPNRHYRHFDISKKGGGRRGIDSPRVFLRVIQWFLADYVFIHFPVHDSVHSFRRGRSIVSNAEAHRGSAFVANIDIENFFGSIGLQTVRSMLANSGFQKEESLLLAKLCCKDDVLPQGAPTSPALSNTLLYKFDQEMNLHAGNLGLKYTRYADDITISGPTRSSIVETITIAKDLLRREYGLALNEGKTRIASAHSQQRVTGVVVNQKVLPPRTLRRQIRAMVHNARNGKFSTADRIKKLEGYVAFAEMFPDWKGSRQLRALKDDIRQVRAKSSLDTDISA